jgi:predicted phosphodiesterase
VAGADTQIGYRNVNGELDPFHDEKAMALFVELVRLEKPERVILAGDIIDLAEQGRWTQEAGFALTTQAAIDRTYRFLYDLREAAPSAKIDLIEGNHDKRMQNFVELNAKSAFGLKRAGWPDEWPVMSIPYLLRLDELKVTYYDAYPNAHVWINNNLRAEHGTKVNSNGSTAQRYLNETPHISRLFGHTHRQEVVQRTTWDRMGKIRSQAINPGCLCRVDGAVPGVHGSIGADGKPATYYEDWQQGAAVIRYTDDEFFVELVQFDDGKTIYQGQELTV